MLLKLRVKDGHKKPKKSKGKGKAHFIEHEPASVPFLAASTVCLMIALQPSRAGPSTTTIASINPNQVTYSTVATPKTAQKFTGAYRKVGPNTLQMERGLLKRMNVTPTIQTLKTMSLESTMCHQPWHWKPSHWLIGFLNPIECPTLLKSLDPLSHDSTQ